MFILKNDLYNFLVKKKALWQNEEEVRVAWVSGLETVLDTTLEKERKYKDSSYNNVIIEFKGPGLFKGKTNSAKFKEAIYDRIQPYILKKAEEDNLSPEEYIGIAIDGNHICFARMKNGEIKYNELLPFTPESVFMVQTALSEAKLKALTVENLVRDFSMQSKITLDCLTPLANELERNLNLEGNNKIKLLFEEWRSLFGQIADLTQEQIKSLKKGFKLDINVSEEKKIPALLFLIHTYNSLIIKLLGAEILSKHELTSMPSFSEYLATAENEDILKILENEIEDGRLFEAAGIHGFVEEALFSWYLEACKIPKVKDEFLEGFKNILIELSFYRTDDLETAQTTDILKGFYQSLVPAELRKSLGEYYTPDWLVEFCLEEIDDDNWLDKKFLDPTCGSASFLLNIINKIRIQATQLNLSAEKQLEIITQNVWGFDLNPLAVQTARLNILISISDLLKQAKGEMITLPILLADSVYSPSVSTVKDDIIEYFIGSQIADLKIEIPSILALNRNRLNSLFEVMGEMVEDGYEYSLVEKKLLNYKVISSKEASDWHLPLKSTYDRVLSLHKKNWNGIWFKIIRNFFWSAIAGEFDYIIGNPPWVRWSNLPELYRSRVKPTCMQYDIFSSTPYHGGNELDISGMITYTVSDKWLKNNGKLIFVITQSHFQAPSSEGFRSFTINDEFKLIPTVVEDFKELKPFTDASNKTAVVVFEKSNTKEINYPIEYNIWKAKSGFKKTIAFHSNLKDVKDQLNVLEMEANPVTSIKSPWAILPKGRFQDLSIIRGRSEWVQGRKGITADLNGIYFVKILDQNKGKGLVKIQTRPEAGRKDIGGTKQYWVEEDFLYPLIKGAGDFKKFKFNPKEELYAFVPNKGIQVENFNESEEMLTLNLPRTKKYFNDFSNLLEKRSTWKLYLKSRPNYAVYNVGTYTFAPYKVLWAEQSKNFVSAVATNHKNSLVKNNIYIPDHKVYFADFYHEEPAYYLCGLLNSKLVKEFIESHNINIQIGNIFKHLNLPIYSEKNKKHSLLAKLVKEIHANPENIDLEETIQQLAEEILLKNKII